MQKPIDVIAAAMSPRIDRGNNYDLAGYAANALDHPDVISNAVDALTAEGWRQSPYELTTADLANIATTVLRSVADGA